MDESQIILKLHEELLKTNRRIEYLRQDCFAELKRLKRINKFLIYIFLVQMIEMAYRKHRNIFEKGIHDRK